MNRALRKSTWFRSAVALFTVAFLHVLISFFPALLVNNWCLTHTHLEVNSLSETAMPSPAVEEEHCYKFSASTVLSAGTEVPMPLFFFTSVITLPTSLQVNAGAVAEVYDSDRQAARVPVFISKRSIVIIV